MKIKNCNRDIWSKGIHEVQELYRHRPPIYDIAVGIFRSCILGFIPAQSSAIVPTMAFLSFLEIPSWFFWSKLNTIIENQNRNEVVLYCIPESSDSTGAATRMNHIIFNILKDLSKSHSIVIKKANKIKDINDAIEEINQQGRKIKTLWISAHGESDDIYLGKQRIVGLGTQEIMGKKFVRKNDFLIPPACVDKLQFKKLDLHADIVLQSCNAGGKSSIVNGLNIAEWFQLYAGPTRRVFAPRTYTHSYGIEREKASDGNVSYYFNILGYDITSEISYEKILEKMKTDHRQSEPLHSRVISCFKPQYRSFDYSNIVPVE